MDVELCKTTSFPVLTHPVPQPIKTPTKNQEFCIIFYFCSTVSKKWIILINHSPLRFFLKALLLTALARLSQLPPATIAALDLRAPYKTLIERLMPISYFPFIFTYLGEPLNWLSYIGSVITEHRLHSNERVISFIRLAKAIDNYDGALTDLLTPHLRKASQPGSPSARYRPANE